MRVTIIADASHCPTTKVAGYGFWIASDRGKKSGDGIFKEKLINSNSAEMMSVANAFHIALKEGYILEGDQVLIQCDCLAALNAFQGKRIGLNEEETSAVEHVNQLTERFSLDVTYRHVKGHTKGEDRRSKSNILCDKKAKANMRRARCLHYIKQVKEVLRDEH